MNFLAKQTHRANLWLLGREGIVRKFGITALLISYMCVLLARLCPTLCKSMEENKETKRCWVPTVCQVCCCC